MVWILPRKGRFRFHICHSLIAIRQPRDCLHVHPQQYLLPLDSIRVLPDEILQVITGQAMVTLSHPDILPRPPVTRTMFS